MIHRKIIYLYLMLFANTATLSPVQTQVKTISNEDELLSLFDQTEPTIVMGSMEACPHCKTIGPLFDDLSKKNRSICFVKANGLTTKMHVHVKNESSRQNTDFKIIGYPAFVFIKDKKIVNVVIGATPERLENAIRCLLTNTPF